ncbi:MAG: DUF4405 domain-containing protein, partial [Verrucomicrobiota bacterium]
MRHVVNFGLLFAFVALAVTGVIAFVLPFSLTTTQIHIIAGFSVIVFVGLHLAGRIPYFQKQVQSSKSASISKKQLTALVLGVGLVLFLAGAALPPISWIVGLSYETRNRSQIVRASSLTGFGEPSLHRKLIARKANDPKSRGLSLHVSFPENLETIPSIAVWAETTAGTMIETLYLHQSMAYSDKPVWHGMKTQRNHILPIWRNRYTAVSGIKPDGEVDVASGATDTH